MEAIFSKSSVSMNFMPGKYGIIRTLLCKYITVNQGRVFTVINNANSGNVEKYAFEEVVCNLRENMNETVDNYVQKKDT